MKAISGSASKPGARIARDEITVWWLPTDAADAADIERWRARLDEDERARAVRFHLEVDRRDFIAAHALLRAMLTSHLGAPADAWRFSTDANGKPGIDNRVGADDVAFNLSHTRGLVAAALASHGAIGVDVEEIDGAKADLTVAEAYFAPAEVELLRRAPPTDRTICFYRLWTLKEAYLKATGAGLGARLDSFAFTLEPIRFDLGAGRDPAQWRFAILPTTGRHVLSVAADRPANETTRFVVRGLEPADL